MSEPRTYLVGLPVAITVHDDGRVDYWIDTAEASMAIREEETEYSEDLVEADAVLVDADHERRFRESNT